MGEFELLEKICEAAEKADREADELLRRPDILLHIINVTNFKIKGDIATRLSVFFTALSAYTREPLNLFIRGPSSIGKTYNSTETLKLFPQEDIWYLGGLSPTALIHQRGELVDKDGAPIGPPPRKSEYESREEYRRALEAWRQRVRDSYYVVDLQGKILLFLESPNIRTFNMLRPILSHDAFEISYKITDKTEAGRLATKHTKIRGWPATIFLNAKDKFIEELATRSFTVSPEEKPTKYRQALELVDVLTCFPWLVEEYNAKIFTVQRAIQKIKEEFKKGLCIASAFYGLHKYYPSDMSRDMRDYQHLTQFIKSIAALHLFQRPRMQLKNREYVLVSEEDVKAGFIIFSNIFETTRTGLSQHLLDFYHKIVKERDMWTLAQLTTEYNLVFSPKRSNKTVRRYVETLCDVGYINVEEDPEDKRRKLFVPLVKQQEKWTKMDNSEMSTFQSFSFEKEFENWIKNIGQQTRFYLTKFSEVEEIQWDALKKTLLQNSDLCPNLEKLFLSFNDEKKSKNMDIQEMSTIVHFSGEKKPEIIGSLERVPPDEYPFAFCESCGERPIEFVNKHGDEVHVFCAKCGWKMMKQLGETE